VSSQRAPAPVGSCQLRGGAAPAEPPPLPPPRPAHCRHTPPPPRCRIAAPWSELLEFARSFDLGSLDSKTHSHIPYGACTRGRNPVVLVAWATSLKLDARACFWPAFGCWVPFTVPPLTPLPAPLCPSVRAGSNPPCTSLLAPRSRAAAASSGAVEGGPWRHAAHQQQRAGRVQGPAARHEAHQQRRHPPGCEQHRAARSWGPRVCVWGGGAPSASRQQRMLGPGVRRARDHCGCVAVFRSSTPAPGAWLCLDPAMPQCEAWGMGCRQGRSCKLRGCVLGCAGGEL
jgi:hypothetical protein